jgi:predicted Fe-S protein YdhL (DUF1289 family)
MNSDSQSPTFFLADTEVVHCPTPCKAVCKLGSNNLCDGCGRTIEEISQWRAMSDTEKWKVIDRIRTTKAQSEELELLNLCPQKLI